MTKQYRTLLLDPPWQQTMSGKYSESRQSRPKALPYPTLSTAQLSALPINELLETGGHCWLWTTNQYLSTGFELLKTWGLKYLAPITWVKPSGLGNWFVHRTQTLLFGYKERCQFNAARYKPTVLFANVSNRHSAKPEESYQLIESVSDPARLEMFARASRIGWDVWGNEVASDLSIEVPIDGTQSSLLRPNQSIGIVSPQSLP